MVEVSSKLKTAAKAELHLPPRGGGRDRARIRLVQRVGRLLEVRAIEGVERLPAELRLEALADTKLFRKREVHRGGAGAFENVAAGIPIAVGGIGDRCEGI